MIASELISQLSKLVHFHGDHEVLCGAEGTLNQLDRIVMHREILDDYSAVYLILLPPD